MTVLALAPQERPLSRCCDTRSVLWNGICRDRARDGLRRAAQALEGQAEVDFDVLLAPGHRIVLADPPSSGLGRRERRLLRRRGPVPVSA